MAKPIIAVTMGDPGGIGPEIIIRTFRDLKFSERFYYLLIGTRAPFEYLNHKFHLDLPLHPIPTLEQSLLHSNCVNFLDVLDQSILILQKSLGQKHRHQVSRVVKNQEAHRVFERGRVSAVNAALAYTSFKVAVFQAVAGLVDAVVTAPVHKKAIQMIDNKFHGHTEYLAKWSGTKKFAMMFVSDRLKVTLATIHIPLKKVHRILNQELIFEKIFLTNCFLRDRFKIFRPRLAVCALNPHGSETGDEESNIILPAVRRAQRRKIQVDGPLSGDQVFHDVYQGRFDAAISMYHDQGLAPFKMLSFRDGVNVTLGLPFVRTSPDHGTALDIAYQGNADPSSMKNALRLAERLVDRP
ncbi:MAG: 4-hydroxythreonine-4-phosphate dehydrogenase PdxA [Candidatus Omnitrophica bacterium]|nr:4-hydroxythreonine-4-phosphate dehydrogenase PdxA [Candidatus Omnitrophota bacterium]